MQAAAARSCIKPLAKLARATAHSACQPGPLVVAVDGPAASGKGTLATRLAATLGLAYLDTGLLYRAVALKALAAGVPLDDEPRVAQLAGLLSTADVVGPQPDTLKQLRSEATGAAASRVSALPAVRVAVNTFPRAFAQHLPAGAKGCVMDGRDVGTVLFPDARVKLFVVATPEVRARRRLLELQARGDTTTSYEAVLQAVLERDARDSQRAAAPLKPATDAVLLDTSDLTPQEVLRQALQVVQQACPELQT